MRMVLILFLILSLSSPAWATNWCNDADIVACYTFDSDSGTGTSLTDDSENSNTGTFKGSGEPAWSSTVPQPSDDFDGTSTYSVSFDGTDDYINIGQDSSLDNISPLSITAWIYPEDEDARRIVDTGNTATRWYFDMANHVGGVTSLHFFVRNTAVGIFVEVKGASDTVPLNQWSHAAVSWDGSTTSANAKLYSDGVELTYSTQTDGSGTRRSDTGVDKYIGSSGSGYYYDGNIDELALFGSALDSTDINDIMDNGLDQGGSPAAARRILFIN